LKLILIKIFKLLKIKDEKATFKIVEIGREIRIDKKRIGPYIDKTLARFLLSLYPIAFIIALIDFESSIIINVIMKIIKIVIKLMMVNITISI
jgi:hypothetical protein